MRIMTQAASLTNAIREHARAIQALATAVTELARVMRSR
jgi:hypothetical protein